MQLKNEHNPSRLRRGLCLVALIALLAAIMLVVNAHPATSYEVSIYDALPTYFWLLVSIPIVMPFIIIIIDRESVRDRLALAIMTATALLALLTFLSLPVLRGYAFFNGGDSLTHLGRVVDIIQTGRIGKTNFYPAIHIWIYATSRVSDTGVISIMMLVPQYYTTIFIISMYSLARSLNSTRSETMMIVALTILPIYGAEHLYVVPSAEAFFLVPLTISILIRSRARSIRYPVRFAIPLILLLVLFPFLHPETTLFLLVLVAVLAVIGRSIRRPRRLQLQDALWGGRGLSIPMLISGVSFLLWFSATVAFGNTIRTVYDSLILNLGQSPVAYYSSLLARANVTLIGLLDSIITGYGVFLMLVVLAAAVAVRTLIRLASRKSVVTRDLILSGMLATLIPILLIFLFFDLVIGTRPMKYVLMISTILAGIALTSLLRSKERHSVRPNPNWSRSIAGLLIVACLTSLALVTAYPSPLTREPNYQITHEDWAGMDFFIHYRNDEMTALDIQISPLRFADALLGADVEKVNLGYGKSVLPVDHFGYNSSGNLGRFYSSNQYLIINQMTRDFYPYLYPEFSPLWRYTPDDFNGLRSDSTVNLFYSNGELDLYEIIGANQ